MYGMPQISKDSRHTIAQVLPGFPTQKEGNHLSSSSQCLEIQDSQGSQAPLEQIQTMH